MKMLLATALLLGASSFTAAHAEWEILDAGTAVNARAATIAPSAAATSGAATEVAQHDATQK